MANFYNYAKPNRTEAVARRHVIEQVRKHVLEALPHFTLEVIGSERTGVALATSDIDLRLMPPHPGDKLPPPSRVRYLLLNKLRKVREKLTSHSSYQSIELFHARYPLISMRDRATGLDIQIVLSNDSSASRNLMQQYMDEYPYLLQVYTVVKTMFDTRGLSDVYRGGFGSYSIFMMIVASLKHFPDHTPDAAGALETFLRFWSIVDTSTHGVSIEPAVLFNKSEEPVMTAKVKAHIEVS